MSKEARRYYPNRELAAHVLGFANVDGKGIAGLELAFEDKLRGSVRAVPAIRDRRGKVVFSQTLLDDGASLGDDLTLTIDRTIQHVAERELALAVQTAEARAGSVVVMDPRTGELLAIANYPTFNPNDPGRSSLTARRDRAVTDRFEPGSTVKPFTIGAALAAGTIRPDQVFDCQDGAMQVAQYTIHDSERFHDLTPAQILAFSSNIGAAKIGATLGRRGLFRAFRRFGFGQDTGVPLPGEASGILRHYQQWYDMDAATIAFGQGLSVTTVQLATAMSAIANDGRLMEPILVKRITDGSGNMVEEHLPRVRRQVIPTRTARLVADMMTGVTGAGGTGTEAAIPGYLVAGKTGTAQKADYVHGGYAQDRWTASFVGFVPAEAPRLTVAVVIDEPIIAHYGGTVAAPAFRRIAEAALRHLGVPATDGGEGLADAARQERERHEANARAKHGAPVGTASVAGGPLEAREAAPAITPRVGQGQSAVPDVAGLGARAALVRVHGAGLAPMLTGSGVVVSEMPAAGQVVPEGTAVRLVLDRPRLDAEPSGAPAAVEQTTASSAEGTGGGAVVASAAPVAGAAGGRRR